MDDGDVSPARVGTTERRPRAVIYTRISRDDSGIGEANDRQETACRLLAEIREWDVVAVERDVSISAWKKKDRPGWNRVVQMMKDGDCDVVLAWKLDRVTRRLRDLVELVDIANETGVLFATTDGMLDLSTPTGRAVTTILGVVSQLEVELKAERQIASNQQRAASGKPWKSGFRAFGYTLDGEVVESEAALVRAAAGDVLDGTPLRAIVRQWNESGVPTPRSRKNIDGWTHNSVRSILLNPRNAGIATYKGEAIGKGTWEPILPEETYLLLIATLTDPSRSKGDKTLGNKPRNLLSGIATCAACGSHVEAGSSGGRKVYKCSNSAGEHLATPREDADAIVRHAFWSAMAMTLPGTISETSPRDVPADLWDEHKRLSGMLDQLASSFASGILTQRQMEVGTTALREQIAAVEVQIENAATVPNDPHRAWTDAAKFLDLDIWAQRKTLQDLATITLWPRNRRRNVPIRQQVSVHVTDRRGRTWPALDERPSVLAEPGAADLGALAKALIDHQPEGVTSLRAAAEWLSDKGFTTRAPGGLPSKLSPLVQFTREQTGAGQWSRK